jgi:predicted nuclease with TOPRIM domain
LRLNPKEKAEEEKEPTKAVLEALKKLEETFSSAKPRFDELKPLVETLVNNAQIILKENWDRVREGERVYRNALIAAKVLMFIVIILFIGGGIYWLNAISR